MGRLNIEEFAQSKVSKHRERRKWKVFYWSYLVRAGKEDTASSGFPGLAAGKWDSSPLWSPFPLWKERQVHLLKVKWWGDLSESRCEFPILWQQLRRGDLTVETQNELQAGLTTHLSTQRSKISSTYLQMEMEKDEWLPAGSHLTCCSKRPSMKEELKIHARAGGGGAHL